MPQIPVEELTALPQISWLDDGAYFIEGKEEHTLHLRGSGGKGGRREEIPSQQ